MDEGDLRLSVWFTGDKGDIVGGECEGSGSVDSISDLRWHSK